MIDIPIASGKALDYIGLERGVERIKYPFLLESDRSYRKRILTSMGYKSKGGKVRIPIIVGYIVLHREEQLCHDGTPLLVCHFHVADWMSRFTSLHSKRLFMVY